MTKYREILRLTALGLSLRDIEKSLKVSRKTVVKVQKRADELSLSWTLDESLTDAELEQRMFPKDLSPKSTKRMPDFDYIRKELLKNGVNKKLLWTEYLEECSQNDDDALMYCSVITFSRTSKNAVLPCTFRGKQASRSRLTGYE